MTTTASQSKFITPLNVGGLTGRKVHIPGPGGSKDEVLFIYGHHSSLERWWGILELISRQCAVTMPDLPGFGGMQSLYKVGKSATLDNLADWLAAFFKQEYNQRKVTVVGMSLGFVVFTRMLQRHPELTKNVNKLVSLFGFASSNDFRMSPKSRFWNGLLARFFSLPVSSSLYRLLLLNPAVLRAGYHKTKNAKQKFAGLTTAQKREAMDFEVKLWRANDLRTHMRTAVEFLSFDNTGSKINLPVYHIAVHNDRYFKNTSVEKHFRQIFTNYHLLAELKSGTHAPTVVKTAKHAEKLIPPNLLNILR